MEVTTEHLKWVKRYINQVRSPSSPSIDLEDLAQEGWIAMWTASEKAKAAGKEINEAYLKQAARWTVLTGLKRRYPDIPVEPEELPDEPFYHHHDDLSAHRLEVRSAVRDLPERQREYVYLRFWDGSASTHQLQAGGYSTSLWYNPRSGAKATLRDKLSHLADAL